MIIERYLLRETAYTFLGVSTVLLLIFLSSTLIRILADAAEGIYPVSIVMELFALRSVGNLVFILPLSFFLAVLLALGRLYKDSEMAAMSACGVGPRKLLLTIGGLALVVGVLLSGIALFFSPWAEERAQRLIDIARARSELEGIEAGRFNQSENRATLFYAEQVDQDAGELKNVFGHGRADKRTHVLAAEGAYKQADPETGNRYLVFFDGHRYEGRPDQPDFRIIEFEEHGILLEERAVVASQRRTRAIPTHELWNSAVPAEMAELQWRISVPISTVLLALAAVPLARTSPRQGRYGKLFLGIVLLIVYNNLLTVARSSLSKGQYGPEVGLWWVHGLMLAFTVVLIWRSNRMPGPKKAGA